ncbi:MAG: AI-2E family transporter [Pseudonocardiales bacterium]|nr:AI-2E family transporter [Pseudonocardiales bacterium]
MRGRGTAIGEGVTWTARWSLRLILVAAGATLLWWLVGALWSVVFPVFLAVILATVLWPPTAWLRARGLPPALAATVVVLLGIVLLAGMIALISASVAGSVEQIAASATSGIQAIRDWLAGPPLNLAESQLDGYIEQATRTLQDSISTIASSLLTGAGTVANGVVTALLTLVLAFLFVKDGPRFLPWVRTVAGDGAGGHVAEVLRRIWKTVGDFIRTQAAVALVDAVLIGAGLAFLGVPLALPLAVLTFLAGFVPIVGAIVAGALGVLVALVSNGVGTAVIVLVLIVAVQQIEGNVLQPMLQSRSLRLHAAVVLLAVTGGSTLYGIAGAFLSVPVVAAAAVVVRYLGERVDDRVAGGAAPTVGPPLETVTTVPGTPGESIPDATRPDPDAAPSDGPSTYDEGPTPPEESGSAPEK